MGLNGLGVKKYRQVDCSPDVGGEAGTVAAIPVGTLAGRGEEISVSTVGRQRGGKTALCTVGEWWRRRRTARSSHHLTLPLPVLHRSQVLIKNKKLLQT